MFYRRFRQRQAAARSKVARKTYVGLGPSENRQFTWFYRKPPGGLFKKEVNYGLRLNFRFFVIVNISLKNHWKTIAIARFSGGLARVVAPGPKGEEMEGI